jgi:hypothetical protein
MHLLLAQLAVGLLNWNQIGLPPWITFATVMLLPLYGVYLASGIITLGLNSTRIRHLLRTPVVISRMAIISLSALFSARNTSWTRTPRQ